MRTFQQIVSLVLLSLGLLFSVASAQESAAERAARLRTQLADLDAKQTELQTRMQQLDEDLKPENIANSLAGVGSLRPEELREQRRKQLEAQKRSVQNQLDQLATTRSRLEAAAAKADNDAYLESAGVDSGAPVRHMRHRSRQHRKVRHSKKKHSKAPPRKVSTGN